MVEYTTGDADIDVTIGDFATTRVNGTFTLAYLVRNTIMNLTTQDAQVECFRNVARHLEPGGSFVIEVIVPPWQRLVPGETVIPFDVSPAHLGFDEIDVATQNSWSHHYWFVDGQHQPQPYLGLAEARVARRTLLPVETCA